MATIHHTTMVPGKLELIGDWLPRQRWYRSTGQPPALTPAGGFRLDDPAGEVGLEFVLVTDGTAGAETTYFVPLAYRGARVADADEGLIGTSEHGVLGLRWIYDGARDPVAVAQLLALVCGATEAQHQSESNVPDPSVGRHWAPVGQLVALSPLRVSNSEPGRTSIAVDLTDAPGVAGVPLVLDLVRVLHTGAAGDTDGSKQTSLGHVEADRTRLDGSTARGRVVDVRNQGASST